jgi:hypothetical protein
LGVRFESEMPMTPPITFPDSNRHSVELLQLALERQDTANLPVLSMAVCRNAYDHLFYFFNARTKENGCGDVFAPDCPGRIGTRPAAMSTLC